MAKTKAKKGGGRGKRSNIVRPLTPEEQQIRDQCDLLLKDFDKQCESLKAESAREAATAQNSVTSLYKLEMMKMAGETKAMKWETYCSQNAEAAVGMSAAINSVVDDSVLAAVQNRVHQLKSAIQSTTSKKGRKAKVENGQETQKAGRTSSRSRGLAKETPATSSRSRALTKETPKSALQTPVNSRLPRGVGHTPMITPKFDTSSLSRTVSRSARAGEVLVSLSGSPVLPSLASGGKGSADMTALIPLGDGNTLNVPIPEGGANGDVDVAVDLDMQQMAKLEKLHKSLGNMLKMRDQGNPDSIPS